MPIVSVVMPVHNAAPYLRKCLDSVLGQTLKDIEVICVENGSCDNSLQILRDYESADNRVRIVVQEDCRGAGHARNEGMTLATGTYLSFLDADDFFDLTMLEQMVNKAEECNAEVVLCDAYVYNDETGLLSEPVWVLNPSHLPDRTVFSYKDLPDRIFQMCIGAAWSRLYRRDFVESTKYVFQVIPSANDLLFAYMTLLSAERVSFLTSRLVFYRRNNVESLSATITSWPDGFYKSLSELKKQLIIKGIYKEVEESFINFCMNYCVWYMEGMKSFKPFKYLWENMRDVYFDELGISGKEKSVFQNTNYYDWYERITHLEPEEWIYEKYCILKNARNLPAFPFPEKLVPQSSKIVLYGAGDVGKSYYTQLIHSRYCQVVLWVDARWLEIGPPVSALSSLTNTSYDYLLISVADSIIADEIKGMLIKSGVAEDKIIWALEKQTEDE